MTVNFRFQDLNVSCHEEIERSRLSAMPIDKSK